MRTQRRIVDAGEGSPLTKGPVQGAEAVAREAGRWAGTAPLARPAVVGITVVNGRITEMDFVLDPAKLARLTYE